MESLTRFAVWFIFATNLILIAMVTIQTVYISEHIVWDIDKVRNSHVHEIEYWYGQGCIRGTNYPPEFKMPSSDFNPNSPPSWCGDQGHAWEDDWARSAWKLGR